MDGNKFNIYDNSKEALACIMRVHGSDVLLGSMLKSYFNDYAPRVETLRKNVIFSVSMSGAGDILKRNIRADDVGHENAFRQAVQRVVDTYGTERGLVESVVSEFTDALGWKINIIQTPNTAAGTQRAEMQHVGMQQVQQVQMQTQPAQVQYAENVQNVDISNLQIGQRNVKFGRYNWRVLDVQSGKALLLAEDIIEKRPYHVQRKDVTWEKCTLRKYLNGKFLKTFSNAEQSRIAVTNVRNENNQWYGTKGGRDTRDSVFLLSIEEVVRYFGDSGQLRNRPQNALCFADRYNDERVAKYEGKASRWWLRSPGDSSDDAAYVDYNGNVALSGDYVDIGEFGVVRPALWINLTEDNASELINEESQHVQPQQVQLRSCNTHKKKYLPRGYAFKWPWQ